MIIVDNNLYSFAYDINNGLPIIPFYDNKKDTQMNELKEFLIKIAHKMNYNKIFKYMYSFQDYLNETKPHKLIDKMHVNYKSLNFKLFK
jgi:CTD small phosphatase-like protein 2